MCIKQRSSAAVVFANAGKARHRYAKAQAQWNIGEVKRWRIAKEEQRCSENKIVGQKM